MSSELPAIKPKQLIRVLETKGWQLDRIRGSHHIMVHPVLKRCRCATEISRPGLSTVSSASPAPVRDFLKSLSDIDAAAVLEEMRSVARHGLREARHLHGDIYEVRADGDTQTFRILFALEGHRSRILLALEGFSKKTRQTPRQTLALAERRLADCRARGRR